jgi:hypothetical protein
VIPIVKRGLLLVALLGATFSLLIVGARGVGAARPLDERPEVMAVLQGVAASADRWCWRGICPGRTKIEDARRILNAATQRDLHRLTSTMDEDGIVRIRWGFVGLTSATGEVITRPESPIVEAVLLDVPVIVSRHSLTFAHIVSVLGTPEYVRLFTSGYDLRIQACFERGGCVRAYSTRLGILWTTPAYRLELISSAYRDMHALTYANDSCRSVWRGWGRYPPRYTCYIP